MELYYALNYSVAVALPKTVLLISSPLVRQFKNEGVPSISIALPPQSREDILAIYGYCFDHNAAAVETFRAQLALILSTDWTAIEKVGFG